jgi:hypothetical protein
MAIIRSAIVARGRKKIGDIVLKRRLGQTIVAQRQLNVKNPKTPKQVAQRARFTIAIGMAIFAKFVMPTVFPKSTYRGTKMNKFTKFILKKIIVTAYPLNGGDIANFNASAVGNGDGFNVIPATVAAHAGKQITVTWNPLIFPPTGPTTGTMSCLVICATKKLIAFEQSAAGFAAGTFTFFATTTPFTAGDKVIVALGQTYVGSDGKVHQSEFQFETSVTQITIIT